MKDPEHACLFRRRKKLRPGEIILAAQAIFSMKGFAATRLEDVAAMDGVSKGTVFVYFKSKELLFKSDIEKGLAPVVEAVEGLTGESGRPVEQLHQYLDAWQRILNEENRTNLLRLLAAESDKFPDALEWFHESVACRVKRTMTNIFEKGIASGNFRRFKPDVVADIFLSPISLSALGDVWKRDSSNEEILKVAFDILIRGLAEGFK